MGYSVETPEAMLARSGPTPKEEGSPYASAAPPLVTKRCRPFASVHECPPTGKLDYPFALGLGAVFSRLDRWAGKFNRWFGSAAVIASAEHSGSAGGPPTLDPTAVVAGLGEIERGSEQEGVRARSASRRQEETNKRWVRGEASSAQASSRPKTRTGHAGALKTGTFGCPAPRMTGDHPNTRHQHRLATPAVVFLPRMVLGSHKRRERRRSRRLSQW